MGTHLLAQGTSVSAIGHLSQGVHQTTTFGASRQTWRAVGGQRDRGRTKYKGKHPSRFSPTRSFISCFALLPILQIKNFIFT